MFAFYPRIDVSNGGTANHADPLSTIFLVKNDGLLPLTNVKHSCGLRRVVFENPSLPDLAGGDRTYGTRLADPRNRPHRLGPGETKGVVCPLAGIGELHGSRVTGADIAVVVEYSLFGLPLRHTDVFPFVTFPNLQGELIWVPKPMPESDEG